MSNCLIYALRQWFKNGGYLHVRKSHYGWWPHFFWSENPWETWWEYAPPQKHRKWFPPIFFRGLVKKVKMRIGSKP